MVRVKVNGVEEKENTEVMPSTYLYIQRDKTKNSNIFVVENVQYRYICVFDVP